MKRMLFIGPNFYNYHIEIKMAFERLGYVVDYFDDRPNTSFFSKIALRLNRNLIKRLINKYFNKIIENCERYSYDIVFVIFGQSFTKEMFKKLRKIQINAKFIFYMFDPFSTMPDRAEFSDVFDECYSFDSDDCNKFCSFKFLPLFFSEKNLTINQIKYDAFAALTMMPGKYSLMKEMVDKLKTNGFNVYKLFFLQSRFAWFYYKMKYKEFKTSKLAEFSFKRLPKNENDKLMKQSRYIIDCPKHGQSGLTIRTLECLGFGKKLITTNKNVAKYDFYCPENIYIYNGNFNFDDIFFTTNYKNIDESIINNYTIDSWAKKIVGTFEI